MGKNIRRRAKVMVVGNGLMAKRFALYIENCEYLLFASGVSDSSNTVQSHFDREELLLRDSLKTYTAKTFVYFSSCDAECIHTKDNLYYQHKRNMENIIKSHSKNFFIFRLPQVVGKGGNYKTLINFFIFSIAKHRKFNLFEDTYKNILDIDDVFIFCDYILKHRLYQNTTINIVNSIYFKTEDIIKKIEIFLNEKAIYRSVKAGTSCKYTNFISKEVTAKVNVVFDENYVDRLLVKYYKEHNNA